MSDTIKEEPSSQREISPYQEPSANHNATSSAEFPQIDPSRYLHMTWKHCDHLPLADQVKVMEKAAKSGISCLQKTLSSLESVKEEIPTAITKMKRIESVRSSIKNCRITFGFLGATGSGKSTVMKYVSHANLLIEC